MAITAEAPVTVGTPKTAEKVTIYVRLGCDQGHTAAIKRGNGPITCRCCGTLVHVLGEDEVKDMLASFSRGDAINPNIVSIDVPKV
jgi:hypothetical protein